jgi:hypothetical protein
MDNDAFDAVVKRLQAGRMTRGAALRGLVGGAAALVGARLALDMAEAKKKKGKKHKKSRGRVARQAVVSCPPDKPNAVGFTGQGLIADGFGGYDLITEICGIANGADADGPYLLWVLTATGAKNASITGPWGTAAMTKFGNGTFKYISGWYEPSTLPGNVSACYDGKAKNAQLVISHGCRPFNKGAWCSPGFWANAENGAWALTGYSRSDLFNTTVYDGFYGATFGTDPTLNTVLTSSGGTYKGPGVSGTDPRTQSPNPALNAFNATGAFLTDHIPGYAYDPSVLNQDESDTCPIDHHGNFKQ